LAQRVVIDVAPPSVDDGRTCTVYLDGEDVTWPLRSSEVDANVSIPSTYAGVRDAMMIQQRRIGERGAVVMVGRDIGTVVLPQADLKIYLDASVEARARRRWLEYQASGRENSYDEILAATMKRDQIDSQRSVAPLRAAGDAVVIDTTSLDMSAVLKHVLVLTGNDAQPSSPAFEEQQHGL
jgi:cytidylate kinase